MKIEVEHLLTHNSDIFEVGRVPCVGELVTIGFDSDNSYIVEQVTHVLDAKPENQVLAIIKIK